MLSLAHQPEDVQNSSTDASAADQSKMPSPLLPCIPDNKRKTLVLDLDQTLVFSSFKPLPNYSFTLEVQRFDKKGTVYVLKRPGVDEFILHMAKIFEMVIFTAGTRAYADPLLNKLDPQSTISYRLYRDSCHQGEGGFVKDLSLLGRDLQKVIIVDDDPRCYSLQPENAVPVVSFSDNLQDRELLDLIPVLSSVAEHDNVTEFIRIKRGQRSRSSGFVNERRRETSVKGDAMRLKPLQYQRFLHRCYWD